MAAKTNYPSIADLRHRIEIQSLVKTADDQGGFVSSWTTLMTIWAKIDNITGQESIFAQRLDANYDHKILIRNAVGITPEMRIVFDNRKFQIHSVVRLGERRFFTEILAKEGVAS